MRKSGFADITKSYKGLRSEQVSLAPAVLMPIAMKLDGKFEWLKRRSLEPFVLDQTDSRWRVRWRTPPVTLEPETTIRDKDSMLVSGGGSVSLEVEGEGEGGVDNWAARSSKGGPFVTRLLKLTRLDSFRRSSPLANGHAQFWASA